ncbi:epoxide hydrolase [Methylobacterium sp. WL64]|uniref:epoxide hydrolase family protein n=1 Tax=Methylobacterium sp. WL64 TaxID=2603894 RepID=UPI0011CA585B|nr:epoxide hydrolase family protein [Methylobacterium sp. WL64]TXN00725.1 epoxide hydrolase [Methylobacterium sp. WL64]
MSDAIEPFRLVVPESDLDDLRRRLAMTRWPEQEPVADRSQGAPLDRVRALCAYWRDGYDWRRCEAWLNGLGQHRTVLDGLGIHFLHVRSPEPDALPLIMTHGWPGSVVEFRKVIGPLTDPAAHGGDPRDAFHLVLPSLPGYGFSDKPTTTGWGVERIANAWTELMARLGYARYAAQGGDWGSAVTLAMAAAAPPGLRGVHVNTLTLPPPPGAADDAAPDVQAARALAKRYAEEEIGYARQQGTRPQTLGYGLSDSPAGQLAWIYEKLCAWTDSGGDAESVLGRDAILDDVMLYWLPNAGASSARLYWESFGAAALTRDVALPVGVSLFPSDITRAPRAWAERRLQNIVHWGEPARGGHFAAFEQPALFVREVRDGLRTLRRN